MLKIEKKEKLISKFSKVERYKKINIQKSVLLVMLITIRKGN